MGKPQDHGRLGQLPRKQHILPQFVGGSKEVNLLFDHPGRHLNSPKAFERAKRSAQAETLMKQYQHQRGGQESILTCHWCKRRLVSFLATYLVNHISNSLHTTQLFVKAGDSLHDEALAVQQHSLPQPDPKLYCNAEEADTRIWLQAVHSAGMKKLVVSPDTDMACLLSLNTNSNLTGTVFQSTVIVCPGLSSPDI